MAIANSIATTLIISGWKLEQAPVGATIVGVVTGIFVHVDKGASESARGAAKELTSALNDNEIDATEEDQDNNPNPTNRITMSVGIKP